MANLTLKQFRYFEALARHGHFGHAAESCAISQPALSMQIKELEQSLGLALFERHARRARLTGFGEEFALRVREILRAVEELEDLARTAQGRLAGQLRVGVIPTIAPYLLPTLINELSKTFPDVEMRIRETLTEKLLDDLADGRLDMAIVALPVSDPAFCEVTLFSEDFVFVRSDEDAGKPAPNIASLRDMRLLLLEEGHCFRDQALSFCNINSAQRRDLLDGSSLTTLVQMVGAGLGVTLIPEMSIPVETQSANVSIARFEPPQPGRVIGMIWRKTSPLTAQFNQVSEVVRASGRMLATARAGLEHQVDGVSQC